MRKLKLFDMFNVIALVLLSLTILVPFMILISQSLMSNEDIINYGYTLFPKHISLQAYKYLLADNLFIYKGFAISFFVTVAGTFCCLLFTGSLAYGLSKKQMPYRNAMSVFVLITMFFSGGLIPSYILIMKLGLKGSLWALILPALISPWYMFLMRSFFMEIPKEVEESALIDGANEMIVLWKIIVPMSMASIATVGLFYAVGHWNSWFPASLYLQSQDKWPLQLILREIISSFDFASKDPSNSLELKQSIPQQGIKAAAILVTSLPIICVYPFIQKYFVKGVIVGSVKG
ncbi:carbohydrate ABC transporter permease [Paenibacillus eucommiae]|uniref:Aldouronate transport system permease protein n=1 Tax=Paenibacillus eucommiae TaxID=1355755 RepID=A0ABS4IX95_9BACL|nr:carbohydrate ABC transporter permease [Paenibacillus eucommiae]MBP1991720.1 putative aldouronate transport system permease protein [Paenibacillus eucommiae]